MQFLILTAICAAWFFLPAASVAAEFDRPWDDPARAIVIDPYAGNRIDWDQLARETRVVAIIHKATVGTRRLDPKYLERRNEAKKRGYLWGSYHWAVAGDGRRQADFYLDTAKPGDDEVMALDLEDVADPKFMNVDEAVAFIRQVKRRTGRLPLVYANHKTTALIARSTRAGDFAGTRLWYARFRASFPGLPNGPWKTYALWQFSSEIKVQYRVPGTDPDMDVNVYNGSIQQLKADWPLK
jgi:lysozyme